MKKFKKFLYYASLTIGHIIFFAGGCLFNYMTAIWFIIIYDRGIISTFKQHNLWHSFEFLSIGPIFFIGNIIIYELWRKVFIDY